MITKPRPEDNNMDVHDPKRIPRQTPMSGGNIVSPPPVIIEDAGKRGTKRGTTTRKKK